MTFLKQVVGQKNTCPKGFIVRALLTSTIEKWTRQTKLYHDHTYAGGVAPVHEIKKYIYNILH